MKHYDIQSVWDKKNAKHENLRVKIACEMIPKSCKSLLDLGAGDGEFLAELEGYYPNMELKGIERSKTAIESKKCKAEISSRGDFQYVPEEPTFECVSSMAVLEHLTRREIEEKVELMDRLASKYLLISVPYRERRVRVVCPECSCKFDPHLHLRSYNLQDIIALFEKWRMVDSKILKMEETIISILIRIFKIELSAKYGGAKVCPQCGWRSDSISTEKDVDKEKEPINMKDFWKGKIVENFNKFFQYMPKIQTDSEIFILFERKKL